MSILKYNSGWIKSPKPNPAARLRLFCFPYAGGGALTYRSWPEALPADVEVCPVQLPGHESRLHEPAFNQLGPLVDALVPELLPLLDRPFAFFGHSMGAMIGFETARRLRAKKVVGPRHLFVSGRRAPHLPPKGERRTYDLPEAEFIEELGRLNGTPREVLEHPELLELVLPILRADFSICQTYAYAPSEPLNIPITALGGADDHDVGRASLEEWREQTSDIFKLHMLPGDHFFIHSARARVCHLLSDELNSLVRRSYHRVAPSHLRVGAPPSL
ncbi:MAG: thioesterase II family protein [Acidobacteriota bacterium]|nr:thioesterase II family protein [Acidobacteriota bacterium]